MLEGRTYLERIASQLAGFEERWVSGGSPDSAERVDFRHVPDSVPGLGPMGGLRDALEASSTDLLLVVPCDMPYFHISIAEYLVHSWRDGDDVLLIEDEQGRRQPLCGLYARACLPVLTSRLARGLRKVADVSEDLRVRTVPLPGSMLPSTVLHNVNRPEDLP
jgi:molybdopterin-guanine dinucleotide biosynthesis protein A